MGFEASGENEEKREADWLDGCEFEGIQRARVGGLVNRGLFL